MILNVYSIYDANTCYIQPFCAMSDNAAIRQFALEINNNPIAKKNASDFALYRIGTFGLENGVITGTEKVHIKDGNEVVDKEV